MTTIFNDPAEFSEDQLDGFVDLYADRLVKVTGGVVTHPPKNPQVAVVVGGGSGHYPAFAGLVGPGFASGAVVGNIFTSPSAAHVYSVAKAADQGKGVILTFGNYAGDNMNFGIAAERLRQEGIDTRIVVVTDDVASNDEHLKRRGIAGDFTVFKVMGAAAAAGLDIDEVEKIGNHANLNTRTMGVAFSGCTMPGAGEPLFNVPAGMMGVGLGIHGEPGIRDEERVSGRELAKLLVAEALKDAPQDMGNRVAVIVNGLGTTKYEELFLLYASVAPLLRQAGLEIVEPEVGELVTSLDMGGVSLTLMWLDEQLEEAWRADAYAAAYRKQNSLLDVLDHDADLATAGVSADAVTPPSQAGATLGQQAAETFTSVADLMAQQEEYLGRIDAVAGDGDHGRGMVRGTTAAVQAITALSGETGFTPGPAAVLRVAGQAWAMEAGGTSGVLWGASLESAAQTLADDADNYTADDALAAVEAFASTIQQLGGAQVGDKTLVDGLVPFVDKLRAELGAGSDLKSAWSTAAEAATQAAEETRELRPKKGRATPLADKSVGNPDPGAISLAMILTSLVK